MKPVELTSAEPDDGTTSGDPSRRGIVRRECHCPEWVIRCVHFEGQVLVLVGSEPRPCECSIYVSTDASYGVMCFSPEGLISCPDCGVQDAGVELEFMSMNRGYDSEADALAAFYEAERELPEMARALA